MMETNSPGLEPVSVCVSHSMAAQVAIFVCNYMWFEHGLHTDKILNMVTENKLMSIN